MNITLYGQASRQADGQIHQQKIEVQADHPFCYYSSYKYFLTALSRTKNVRLESMHPGRVMPVELLVRVRRCIAFTDITGLHPTRDVSNELLNSLKILSTLCNLDHVSIWRSSVGTMFILNEPYGKLEHVSGCLAKYGFAYIELPTQVSPYCGGWADQVGAVPCSTSYFISNHDSNDELLGIQLRIQAEASSLPLWNDTVGVSYV